MRPGAHITIRIVLTLSLFLIVPGCSYTLTGGWRGDPNLDLRPFVGQTLTLQGKFTLAGKFGPYVQAPAGPVYLLSECSFSCPEYQGMEGKMVRVTGTLRFRHSPQVTNDGSVAPPPDYFYFDTETAKIKVR